MENKKAFRPTPSRFQNSFKILSGTKTNATIRDLEEEDEELEEKEGTVVSISRDKINGTGWVVKDDEGNIYNCSCSSNMYDLPDSVERGGVLYPNETIKVKFKINPVLRINVIEEVTSLKEKETLDIGKWKHGEASTTVIAKPKSAISISDSKISFNYDNKNEITADEESIDLKGKETNIKSEKVNIDAEEVDIKGIDINTFIEGLNYKNNIKNATLTSYTGGVTPQDASSVYLMQERNLVSATIDGDNILLNDQRRLMADIKEQRKHPLREQKFVLLTDKGMDEIQITTDGLITFRTDNKPGEPRKILSTHNWLAPQYDKRHTISTFGVQNCSCCHDVINEQTFINYCPICNGWLVLSQIENNVICNTCGATFCGACGHYNTASCYDTEYDLKKYDDYHISVVGDYCRHCNQRMREHDTKEYVNYCPSCKKWNFLDVEVQKENGKSTNILHCRHCHQDYCANCGTIQNDYEIKSFSDNVIYYDDYIKQISKLLFIREQ